jgi:hypothetical protein
MMKKRKDPNVYPPGLNARKVAETIAYYDARQAIDLLDTEDHQLVFEPTAWVEVPVELVPEVKKLITRRKKSA